MSLRLKLISLAVLPLLAALLLIALVVSRQEADLAAGERALVERAYVDARRTELKHYVDLALSTVRALHDDGAATPGRQAEALRRLQSLDYGPDGYFFVYDYDGRVLMHSRQPELVGQNLWTLRDPDGRLTIQDLIAQARAGGGYVDYRWRKPSNGQLAPKIGYVVGLPRWGWMVGTGLYRDDIEATVVALDAQARAAIGRTLLWVGGVAVLGVALISASGLALNLSEHRVADAKLRRMAQQVVRSQEDERAHLARELHDGTSQTLVATKLLVESARDALRHGEPAEPPLATALARLNDALGEVRGLSHRLRPALLDTLGLPAALERLADEMAAPGRAVGVRVEGAPRPLPEVVNTVLFRVAQEALTNVAKHANAANVELALAFADDGAVQLRAADDGGGFDADAVQQDPRRGLGLRHMRERLDGIGGRFELQSSPGHGTQVEAAVPAPVIAALDREADTGRDAPARAAEARA